MTTHFLRRDPSGALPETQAERQARIAYERALLDEARADVAAGRVVDGAEVEYILEAFLEGEPLQMPDPGASPIRR